jgi:hypothetical protein
MNARVLAVLLGLPLLVAAIAVGGFAMNRSGGRLPMTLSEREVTIGPRGSDTAGRNLWLSWTDRRRPVPRPTPRQGLRRRTFVVLALDSSITDGSRLVPVEEHRDPDLLARKYPDGRTHIIAAATLMDNGALLQLNPPHMVIPRELTSRLPPVDAPTARIEGTTPVVWRPRFTVQVRWGRRWEPWVSDISW